MLVSVPPLIMAKSNSLLSFLPLSAFSTRRSDYKLQVSMYWEEEQRKNTFICLF